MTKIKKFLTLRWDWLKISQNRKNMYKFMRFGAAPVLIAVGLVSPSDVDKWLGLVAPVLLFGSSTVAHRNVQ